MRRVLVCTHIDDTLLARQTKVCESGHQRIIQQNRYSTQEPHISMKKGRHISMLVPMIVVGVVLLASTVDQASALKCWRCSSDSVNGNFCNDPFDASTVTVEQRRLGYVECAEPPQQPFGNGKVQRSVCKKLHQIVNDRDVVTRSCLWEDVDAPSDRCETAGQMPSYVRIKMCRTCITDGCNGDSKFAELRSAPTDGDKNDEEPLDDKSGAQSLRTTLASAIGSLVTVLLTALLLVR